LSSTSQNGAGILERVLRNIARHRMLPAGGESETRVGVAVSGGADSVGLLEILTALAGVLRLRLSVIHLDHQLRGEDSDADARFVSALAAARGLPLHLRRVDVRAAGGNLEQAARMARYSFFHELIASGAVEKVATGHTRDDQAETVLFRILRGCGLTGLSGILPMTAGGVIRPLLTLTGDELRDLLRQRGIVWREDATNTDLSLARNRLRREVMPALRNDFNPRLDEALASLADLAREEERYWDSQAPVPETRNGVIVLNTLELTSIDRALARRRVRAAIGAVKGDLLQIEMAHVDLVIGMAQLEKGSGRAQIPGVDVFRSFDWVRLAPYRYDSGRERNFRVRVTVPGQALLPEGTALSLHVLNKESAKTDYARVKMDLDWLKILGLRSLEGASWEIRNWRPGDCYQPVGYSGDQKLKQLFQEHRIALWERRHWPVFVYEDRILWARRFGPAAGLEATSESELVLRISEDYVSEP
jgi:tRNA(Ile)-lysidine synthase